MACRSAAAPSAGVFSGMLLPIWQVNRLPGEVVVAIRQELDSPIGDKRMAHEISALIAEQRGRERRALHGAVPGPAALSALNLKRVSMPASGAVEEKQLSAARSALVSERV